MNARLIFGAFLRASRPSRISASLLGLPRRTATRSGGHHSTGSSRRRGQESGYAFLFVLGLILVMIAASVTVLQMGATIRRRRIEQETIWRGNQYARAVRLYYHKTGHYPQTLDDLVKGMPDLHFLRQAYKNPTNSGDGSWRFIYVNAAGQIIGSTKYANLQQMALMDANGGQLPTIPGQPGVPVSTLAGASSGANSQPPQNNTPVLNDNSTGSTPAGYTPPDSTQNGSTQDASGNPSNTQNGQPPNGDNYQNPSNNQNSQNPQNPQSPQNPLNPLNSGANSSSLNNLGLPQNNQQGLAGLAVNQASLAAMALLKPTGPVDGPVLGGFLTGVGCTQDTHSQRVYHGGKKYIDWEFIWNPLEDAAAAMQQQLGGAQGGGLGQGIATSPFGASPNSPATSNQQNPSQPPSNPLQQQPQ
jgi:hypothetical protein